MLRKSYYLTLGVSPNESAEGIREAFRDIAKRYHPDRVGAERSVFFQEIVEAYHVLADPERRRDYDRGLYDAEFQSGAASTPVPIGSEDPGDLPQTVATLRTVFIKDAPFEAALARVSGRLTAAEVASRTYCEGLDAAVVLSADEAKEGGLVYLNVPSCSPCDRCGGSGREGLFPCALCDGEGLIEEQETVRVFVPPMTGDGAIVNVPLRGLGVHSYYLRLHVRVG